MTFTHFNKKNGSCPICASDSGKCRQTDDLILCMDSVGTPHGDEINGYFSIGDDKSGQWGRFLPISAKNHNFSAKYKSERTDNGNGAGNRSSDANNRSKKKNQATKKKEDVYVPLKPQFQQKKAKPVVETKPSITLEVRASEYKRILDSLELTPSHRRLLEQRGMKGSSIARYKSANKYQSIPSGITQGLPGKLANDTLAIYHNDVILVPVVNCDGQVIAMQRRLASAQPNVEKYLWVSNEKYGDPLAINGETPIGVYNLDRLERGEIQCDNIVFAEGYMKPDIASNHFDNVFIGAANANFTKDGFLCKQVIDVIDRVQACNPSTKISLSFAADAGAVENYHIMIQYYKAHHACARHGYDLQFLWYGQAKKLKGWDIDEIILWEALPEIKVIEWADFLNEAPDHIRDKIRATQSPDYNPADKRLAEFSHLYREINKKYVGVEDVANLALDNEFAGKVVGIKSVQGTGKTVTLGRIAAAMHSQGYKVEFVTHRTSLGQSLAQSLGVVYLGDRSVDTLPEGDRHIALREGFGICINSLYKVNIADYDSAILILDECMQTLKSLTTSSTIINKDAIFYAILDTLHKIILRVLSTGGTIFCLDADLCVEGFEYIQQICNKHQLKPEFLTLNNLYTNKNRGEITLAESREQLLVEMQDAFDNEEKVYVCGDSKEYLKTLYEQCPYLSWDEKPELGDTVKRKILLCSETTSTEGHPAAEFCGDGITTTFDSNCLKYGAVFASTSIATGSSQFTPHFDRQLCFYAGMIDAPEICQQMMRIRYALPIHMYIKKDIYASHASLPFNGLMAGGEIKPEAIIDYYWAKYRQLKNLSVMTQLSDESEMYWGFASPEFDLMAKIVSKSNESILNLKAHTIALLKEKGFSVYRDDKVFSPVDLHNARTESQAIKAEIKEKERSKELSAKQISELEFNKLSKKTKVTEDQRWEVKRYQTEQLFGQDVSAELLIARDEDNAYNYWRHQWLTKTDWQKLLKLELSKAQSNVANAASRGMAIYLPTAIKNEAVLANVYQYLGFDKVMADQHEVYTDSHPIVERLRQYINATETSTFKKMFGISPKGISKNGDLIDKPALSILITILRNRFGVSCKLSKKVEVVDGVKKSVRSVTFNVTESEDMAKKAFAHWNNKVELGLKDFDKISATFQQIISDFSHSSSNIPNTNSLSGYVGHGASRIA